MVRGESVSVLGSRRRPGRAVRLAAAAALGLAAAVASTSCSAFDALLAPPPESETREVATPLRFESGLPLVEARLPGDQRAWFLVDTGAGDFTLFDSKLSKQLGLRHDVVHDPGMPSVHLSAALPFLEVDGMGRRDVTVLVADGLADRADLASLGVPVQGVLGAGFFRGQCLGFDWAKGTFTATRPRVRLARHVVLPLRRSIDGELRATVKVNGVDAQALLDTAAPRTLVTQEFADRAHVVYDHDPAAKPRDTSIGTVVAHEGTCDPLCLATEERARTKLLVVERTIANADLVLGTDVLSCYGVTLDLADHAYLVLDPKEGAATSASQRGDPHE
jgi:predicted aspartyl protease